MAGNIKEFKYRIPEKLLNNPIGKPVYVRAWETAVPGLIAQRPIRGSRTKVHLSHKASGSILVFAVKNLARARGMAKKLKPLKIPFTAADPRALYRYFARFSDRQVIEFRQATGMLGQVEPETWRGYCKAMVKTFAEVIRAHKGHASKPAAASGRSRKGGTWKGKGQRKSRQGRR